MRYGEQLSEREYDTQLEHMVDTGVMSYVEARAVLGQPPYEMVPTAYDGVEAKLGKRVVQAAAEPSFGDRDAIGRRIDFNSYTAYTLL